MITGAASADIAILIVDVDEGIKQQTKKHSYLLKLLGFEKVITLYNKMDKIDYSQSKFLKIKSELETFFSNIGIKSYSSIPISSRNGDNVVILSKKTEWYKGSSFVEILDEYKIQKNCNSESIRFPVQDIYKLGDKRIIVGRIESGKIKLAPNLFFFLQMKLSMLKH